MDGNGWIRAKNRKNYYRNSGGVNGPATQSDTWLKEQQAAEG